MTLQEFLIKLDIPYKIIDMTEKELNRKIILVIDEGDRRKVRYATEVIVDNFISNSIIIHSRD